MPRRSKPIPDTIPDDEVQKAAALMLHWEGLEQRRRLYPWEWYEPSFPGKVIGDGKDGTKKLGKFANQNAFHRSPAINRVLCPGNGWGKSYAMFHEANAWGSHRNEWQTTPTWPVIMVWFAPSFDQFDIMKTVAETEIFGPEVKSTDRTYTWPDGSMLYIASFANPSSWKKKMGIPADLIFFDEPPPLKFWEEMTMRRRGHRQTRYVIGSTMVEPEHWTEERLFKPWLEHFRIQGVAGEEDALFAQLDPKYQPHPTTFIWHRGGIADNVGQQPGDVAYYDEATKLMHPEERRVRLQGGWGNWRGACIFNADAIAYLRAQVEKTPAPRSGMLVCLPEEDEFGQVVRPEITDIKSCQPADLVGRRFGIREGLDFPALEGMARLHVWELPRPGDVCVAGADFAHARPNGDYDACTIYNKSAQARSKDGRAVQVAELEGKWGPLFAPVLYAFLRLFNDPFLLGEFQGGGDHVLAQLWHHYDYHWQYTGDATDTGKVYDKMPDNPQLGWFAHANDVVWTNFRSVVARRGVLIRSRPTIEQMAKVIWTPRSSLINRDGKPAPDASYRVSLSSGGSPDRTIANAYAVWALDKVVHFDRPEPKFPPGSYGDIFKLEQTKPGRFGPAAEPVDPRTGLRVPGKRRGDEPPAKGGWFKIT